MSTATPLLGEVEYPTSDGKPMAETDLHALVLTAIKQLLMRRYAVAPNSYVSGNNLMYYEQGNSRNCVSPDVYVVHGIPKRLRDIYLVWDEGKGPDLVIETTSKTTRREDLNTKFALYRDVLKVREYFLFDPLRDYLKTSLKGNRLIGQEYVPIDLIEGRMPSEQLGLHLEPRGSELKFWDPTTKSYVLTLEEEVELYHQKFGPLQ